jgi:hypothetical protein
LTPFIRAAFTTLLLINALPAWADVGNYIKQVTDSTGVVWSLTADTRIWRNDVPAAGGLATDLFIVEGMIQVTGMDGRPWRWNGMGWEPVTTSLTMTPPPVTDTYIKQVTDSSGVVWSLTADTRIWRNDVPAAGGLATDLFIVNGMIEVAGMDGRRWRWNGAGWEPVMPPLSPPPPSPPPPSGLTLNTDLAVYYEPALPAMGSAGSTVVDPTFGTTILRVTDPTTGGSDCITPYSYYPNFNSSTTRLYVECIGPNAGVFYTFDAATFSVANGRTASSPPTGSALWYGMVWSGFDPDIIYIQGLTDLWAYNPGTDTYSLVRSFAGEVQSVGAAYLQQMSMSRNDDVFAFSLVNSSRRQFGYLVWQRSINQVLLSRLDDSADEVHVDKSGRYLNVQTVGGTPQIWDLQTGTMTQLGSFAGGDGYYHLDTGYGTIFTGYGNGLGYRSMATPYSVTSILSGYFGGGNQNYSMNADNELWALVWVQRNDTLSNTQPFDNELLQVATDGSGRVRRIAHHRSKWDDYYDQPNANISRDGQFVAFTSNWGNASGRRDVYIVRIPPAPTN